MNWIHLGQISFKVLPANISPWDHRERMRVREWEGMWSSEHYWHKQGTAEQRGCSHSGWCSLLRNYHSGWGSALGVLSTLRLVAEGEERRSSGRGCVGGQSSSLLNAVLSVGWKLLHVAPEKEGEKKYRTNNHNGGRLHSGLPACPAARLKLEVERLSLWAAPFGDVKRSALCDQEPAPKRRICSLHVGLQHWPGSGLRPPVKKVGGCDWLIWPLTPGPSRPKPGEQPRPGSLCGRDQKSSRVRTLLLSAKFPSLHPLPPLSRHLGVTELKQEEMNNVWGEK